MSTYPSKILSVTCDNASANDAMMDELEFMLAHFEGQTTRVWCILHMGNLVAKCLIKQFDIPCKTGSEDQELYTLAEGLDLEDYKAIGMINANPDVDDTDNSVDEITCMDMEDWANLEQQIRPVRMALTKVCA